MSSATNEVDTHEMPPTVVTMLGVPEVILGATTPDSDESDAKPAPAPAKLVQPPTKAPSKVAPAPDTPPKDVARKATPANTNLAKILAGQVAPTATPNKPPSSSGRK